MGLNLKDNFQINKLLLVFSFVCAGLSLFVIFLSDVLLPVAVALLAVVFLLERSRTRIFSIGLSLYLIVVNVLSILFLEGFLFSGVEIVLLALIIAICFSKNSTKGETAFILSIISALFIFVNASFFAMTYNMEYTVDSVIAFYSSLYRAIEAELLNSFSMIAASLPEEGAAIVFDSEQVSALLKNVVSLMPSYIAAWAFVVVGVTLKIFSFISYRLTGSDDTLVKWRFAPSSLFAYFYVTLFVLSIFTGVQGSLFAVSIANLSSIFCFVFAYVGFNFAYTALSSKRSKLFSFVLLLFGLLVFSSLMIEILSFVGAFVTVASKMPRED